jgi:hypothetical protein
MAVAAALLAADNHHYHHYGYLLVQRCERGCDGVDISMMAEMNNTIDANNRHKINSCDHIRYNDAI